MLLLLMSMLTFVGRISAPYFTDHVLSQVGKVAVLFVEGPRYGVGVSLGSKFPTPPLSRGVAVEVKSCGTVDVSCDEVAIASDCPWLSYFAGCRRYVIGIGEALFG